MAAQPGVKAAQVQLAPAPRPREPVVLQELVLLAIAPALVVPEIELVAQKLAAVLAIEPVVPVVLKQPVAVVIERAVLAVQKQRAALGHQVVVAQRKPAAAETVSETEASRQAVVGAPLVAVAAVADAPPARPAAAEAPVEVEAVAGDVAAAAVVEAAAGGNKLNRGNTP
jgi:hypothetical protein